MSIDFEKQVSKIIPLIESADGYLDCEKLIINNIREQLANGVTNPDVEGYLKKLHHYFDQQIIKKQSTAGCINYGYAAGFVNTLITTPYWRSWINATKL